MNVLGAPVDEKEKKSKKDKKDKKEIARTILNE